MGAVVAMIGGGKEGILAGVSIFGEFPWGEAFDEVRAVVFSWLEEGFSDEVEAVEVEVWAVVGVIDGEDDEEKRARLGSIVVELEKAMEELMEGLD